ncbi:HNH endonuclease signature motif containing protein [Sphingomonas echinoides]|uniref:HNH endonuclease signature motif containing protein n=1 Tax=Sphingomonas echinoides TaxID=59803 RepID=A0ABU4PNQ2_9SPHN|nr:HNH endonuclease signature motif containing protein [Sphingomonas echinoides]MDX5985059.1 HNH endonuclease signature motif containing protein [Sphingomonas echinoides]
MNRTQAALVSRGVDTVRAQQLVADGWTVSKLRASTEADLTALGLGEVIISQIVKGARPAIPIPTLMQVLFANRFTCCVCRNSERGIILHHIIPWETSRDHSAPNLAVLCLEHHEKAHIRSTLSRNLDADALRSFKAEWEEVCRHSDLSAILQASRLDYDAWLYFNHLRLFELAKQLQLRFKEIDGFNGARRLRLIDAAGHILPRNSRISYMYDGAEGQTLYHYVRGVLEEVLKRIRVVNFSDLLDRSNVHALLAAGDFLLVQGAHTFKGLTDRKKGQGEAMQGSRRANNVELRYSFDRWEATSMSAWSTWLAGRQSVASLVQVKDIQREDGDAVIAATVIAISNGHHKLQHRNYSPRYGRYMFYNYDEDEADDDWGDLDG